MSLFLHDACGGEVGRAGYALDIGRVCSFRDFWSTAQVRGAAGEGLDLGWRHFSHPRSPKAFLGQDASHAPPRLSLSQEHGL